MFNGAGEEGGGVTARRANGKRERAAAVANGERGTGCHVPRLRVDRGAGPCSGWAVLYWANWERPGWALRGGPWGLHPLPQTPSPHSGVPEGTQGSREEPSLLTPRGTFNPPPR